MILADLVLGARQWLGVAIALGLIALVLVVWAYSRAGSQTWVRLLAGLLKAAGITLLAICLVEPLFTGTRPRPGSNLLLVVADNSRSLQLADRGSKQTRGQIESMRNPEVVARLAREKLGYAKPDETVIIFEPAPTNTYHR